MRSAEAAGGVDVGAERGVPVPLTPLTLPWAGAQVSQRSESHESFAACASQQAEDGGDEGEPCSNYRETEGGATEDHPRTVAGCNGPRCARLHLPSGAICCLWSPRETGERPGVGGVNPEPARQTNAPH
ncbi:hypothetical protein AAFF_G00421430 [Aldrovandia affinis]|uniref:Uncharacterized protein n=1 Tax=Aldrovandia affinis TaxID=143900 RepID=A0AAD7S9V7_9TELE|nr:hypothetical protein AAFF_G00421430 [Aldrovandia affinis]